MPETFVPSLLQMIKLPGDFISYPIKTLPITVLKKRYQQKSTWNCQPFLIKAFSVSQNREAVMSRS